MAAFVYCSECIQILQKLGNGFEGLRMVMCMLYRVDEPMDTPEVRHFINPNHPSENVLHGS